MIGSAFLKALLLVVIYAVSGYKWIVVIRALLSWVNPDPHNAIVRALSAVTDPVLRPFWRILPPTKTGNIDFSPVFVFLILQFIEIFLKEVYYSLWRSL